MKFASAFVLTALLSYAAGFYFPWWSIVPVAFLVAALLPQKPVLSFTAGFVSLFLLWIVLASYMDVNNHHLLSQKIAQLFFKTNSYFLLLLVTGLVAGLAAGMGALTASFLRKQPLEN